MDTLQAVYKGSLNHGAGQLTNIQIPSSLQNKDPLPVSAQVFIDSDGHLLLELTLGNSDKRTLYSYEQGQVELGGEAPTLRPVADSESGAGQGFILPPELTAVSLRKPSKKRQPVEDGCNNQSDCEEVELAIAENHFHPTYSRATGEVRYSAKGQPVLSYKFGTRREGFPTTLEYREFDYRTQQVVSSAHYDLVSVARSNRDISPSTFFKAHPNLTAVINSSGYGPLDPTQDVWKQYGAAKTQWSQLTEKPAASSNNSLLWAIVIAGVFLLAGFLRWRYQRTR